MSVKLKDGERVRVCMSHKIYVIAEVDPPGIAPLATAAYAVLLSPEDSKGPEQRCGDIFIAKVARADFEALSQEQWDCLNGPVKEALAKLPALKRTAAMGPDVAEPAIVAIRLSLPILPVILPSRTRRFLASEQSSVMLGFLGQELTFPGRSGSRQGLCGGV